MSLANQFNKWMYDTICPYVNGEILEIGSGIGNISGFFIEENRSITLSDIDEYYNHHLRKEYPQLTKENKILSIDLQKANFNEYYIEITEKFDTVFLLNVLEHLQDESYAIQNCRHLLKKEGTLIILVPAYSYLFSEIDKSLGHYRRYTKRQLTTKIKEGNFDIERSFYFNSLGIIAWLYGKLMKYKFPPGGDIKFFNKLIPFARILDKLIFHKAGLSAITVAKKNDI